MSETTPDPRPGQKAPKPASGGASGMLTRKFAGFPGWAWIAIVAGLLGWRYYSSKKTAKAAAATTASAATAADSTSGSTVPQFVNQTYTTTVVPPESEPPMMQHPPAPAPAPLPTTPPAKFSPASVAKIPATVSGAPGSYTTGLANGMNEWTSQGGYSLNVLAQSHGMTAQQLIASSTNAENNVPLQRYLAAGNYNAKVPSGVQLFFPSQYWNQPLKKVG